MEYASRSRGFKSVMTAQTGFENVFSNHGGRTIPCLEVTDPDEVLFEQLEYLIRFADQERARFERVRAILMEPFR